MKYAESCIDISDTINSRVKYNSSVCMTGMTRALDHKSILDLEKDTTFVSPYERDTWCSPRRQENASLINSMHSNETANFDSTIVYNYAVSEIR